MNNLEVKQIANNLKELSGVDLVLEIRRTLPKGKYIGYPDYIHINEDVKQVRVSKVCTRWANNAEKVFLELGYGIELNCMTEGTIMV